MTRGQLETCDLSVVIVSWNTLDLLAQCLGSISAVIQTLGVVETVVVDNASNDGSAAMVRERFPWVRLIENGENVGFARANNQAIKISQGRYVLLLNSDTEVHPDALHLLLQFMERNREAGGCGPLLLNSDGSLQVSCYPMLTPWRELWRLLFLDQVFHRATYNMARWDRCCPREVEVVKGACLMLRREAVLQVGLLDPRYFMYTEEFDLCFRMLQAGWKLFWVPQAQVVHHEGCSTRQVAEEMYVQLYRSKAQFFRKTGGEAQARLFRTLLTIAYLPRLFVASALTPFKSSLGSRVCTFRRLLADIRSF